MKKGEKGAEMAGAGCQGEEREALLCLRLRSSLPTRLTCSSSTLALRITECSFIPLVLHPTLTTRTLLPAVEPKVPERHCTV